MALDTPKQIRHLASSYKSSLIAAGEFEHIVSIWDIERAEKTAEFETVLDFGGLRLLITDDARFCVTAAYHIHGVACYSAADGTRIWQRKDLKKAQRLTPSRDGNSIFCGFSEGPCELLDVRTGETIAKIRATRNVVESRYQPISFVDRLRPELTEVTGNRIAFIPRETFAVLTVAFSPTSVCISECGGPVRCLETSRGNEIWRYTPLPGKHVLSLEYSSSADCFYGVEWPYAQGGVKELLRFKSESGQDSKVTLIGGPAETTFCMAGKRLLTSLGQLIELETGETVRQIPF